MPLDALSDSKVASLRVLDTNLSYDFSGRQIYLNASHLLLFKFYLSISCDSQLFTVWSWCVGLFHSTLVFASDSVQDSSPRSFNRQTDELTTTPHKPNFYSTKLGHCRPLFALCSSFLQTANSKYLLNKNCLIRTRVLWYKKWPFCQLCHNHCR